MLGGLPRHPEVGRTLDEAARPSVRTSGDWTRGPSALDGDRAGRVPGVRRGLHPRSARGSRAGGCVEIRGGSFRRGVRRRRCPRRSALRGRPKAGSPEGRADGQGFPDGVRDGRRRGPDGAAPSRGWPPGPDRTEETSTWRTSTPGRRPYSPERTVLSSGRRGCPGGWCQADGAPGGGGPVALPAAVRRLGRALGGARGGRDGGPRARYVTNRTARAARAAAGVREDLAKSVMCPVRWDDATSLMAELGCSLFVEALPGRVLSRLAAQSEGLPRAVALADAGARTAAVRVRRASEASGVVRDANRLSQRKG